VSSPARTLKFLGTAGARFVVSTQLRHSGGLVWTLGGATVWVDPGPGALVRALSSRPRVDPAKVDALVVTHRHLDHAGDATAVVEAMSKGGFAPRGALVAPREEL
jgi:ribonuclease BN (tRNA processing enzyme)